MNYEALPLQDPHQCHQASYFMDKYSGIHHLHYRNADKGCRRMTDEIVLKEIFRRFDMDNDGCLSKEELKKAFSCLGFIGIHEDLEALAQYVAGLGRPRVGGETSKPKHVAGGVPFTKEQLRDIFKRFDCDKDGRLSKEELKKAFKA
ncbi:Calcium-binding EF-hand [Corchorus capsularis]|uniref:Calcium-binding EF-hand n=1 Tax=Corchorus capsularis TaxID=210143 RepID=A0A1R3HU33_COCAP|nr:Calcium-binding EF-hand [Corchorus capsularis]